MKTRDQLVLSIVALAGVMAALWLVVLAPKRDEATKVSGRVSAAETRRDAATAKAVEAEQARAAYKRNYATVARLGKATPAQADVASLVYQLESAARRAKVDFRSVALAQEVPGADSSSKPATDKPGSSGITPVSFTLTFKGKFFKLHKLLSSVDRFSRLRGQKIRISGRLLTLDAVNLTAAPEGFPMVKVQITARAYVAPIPDALPATGNASTATANPNPATQVTP
jgi:hypothetical protein